MNQVSKIAATFAAGIAGLATVAVLTASGGTVAAEGVCTDDMHWVVCPTVAEITGTVTDITDGITGGITDDMHW